MEKCAPVLVHTHTHPYIHSHSLPVFRNPERIRNGRIKKKWTEQKQIK